MEIKIKYSNFYRLLTVVCLVIMLGSVHVAAAKTTITFWHFLGAGSELDALNIMVEEFEKAHPDIDVEMLYSSWGTAYYEKLLTSVIGGSPPDVAMMHATKIAEFAQADLLYELTPMELNLAGIRSEDYFPVPWRAAQYQGRQLGLPFDIHPIGLYMNPNIMGQAGLPVAAPTTASEMFEQARRMNKDINGDGILDVNGLGVRNDGYTFYRIWYSIINQNGVNLLNPAGDGLNTDPYLIEAINILQDARDNQSLIIGVNPADFLNEKAGYFLDGVWYSGGFTTQGMEFETAPIPVFVGDPAAWTDSHLITLPRPAKVDVDKMNASKEFAKWMTQNNFMWSKLGGHVSPSRRVLNSAEYRTLKHQVAFAKMLPYVVYFPQVVGSWEMQDSISDNLLQVMQTTLPPVQAMEEINTTVKTVLAPKN
jgi:multiple sugar transport system substrate-binding protein